MCSAEAWSPASAEPRITVLQNKMLGSTMKLNLRMDLCTATPTEFISHQWWNITTFCVWSSVDNTFRCWAICVTVTTELWWFNGVLWSTIHLEFQSIRIPFSGRWNQSTRNISQATIHERLCAAISSGVSPQPVRVVLCRAMRHSWFRPCSVWRNNSPIGRLSLLFWLLLS